MAGPELTSPDKELWPGITKRDYAAYLDDVAGAMLPHLRDRPLSLQRFNAGIAKDGFFQKDAGRGAPDWLRTVTVGKRGGGEVHHPVANDRRTLRWLAQINALTIHVAPVRRDRLDRPDRLTIDLDPSRADDFDAVRTSALALGEAVRELGLEPFAMVTGSRGIHVVCPLRRTRPASDVLDVARHLAHEAAARDPGRLTTEFKKAERDERIYLDIARNAPAQTAVAPYSPRARPGAPVATPLRWEELEDRGLRPDGFTIAGLPGRLDALGGDPWAGFRKAARALPRV